MKMGAINTPSLSNNPVDIAVQLKVCLGALNLFYHELAAGRRKLFQNQATVGAFSNRHRILPTAKTGLPKYLPR
jgi:hypothetical protein